MSRAQLASWLNANMPEVFRQLNARPLIDGLDLMNKLTGLSLTSDMEVESCCAKFLAVLESNTGKEPLRFKPSFSYLDRATVEHPVEAATRAERARILAAIESVAPMEQPYTRRDWALEQKGAKEHHAKILRAIEKEAK